MKVVKYLALALLIASFGGHISVQAQGPSDYDEESFDDGAEPVYPGEGIVGGTIEGAGDVVADIGSAIGTII